MSRETPVSGRGDLLRHDIFLGIVLEATSGATTKQISGA